MSLALKKCKYAQDITLTLSYLCTFVMQWTVLYNPRLEHTHLQIQFVQFKSNFLFFFFFLQSTKSSLWVWTMLEKQPSSTNCKSEAVKVSYRHIQYTYLYSHMLRVHFLLTLTVWQRRPYKLHPPLEATLRRSLYTKHTSWFGISAGRRASEPAGTRTTATQRYGFLNVCGKTDWDIHLCWDLYLKQLNIQIYFFPNFLLAGAH